MYSSFLQFARAAGSKIVPVLFLVSIIGLYGCKKEYNTGVFLDSPVEGLEYNIDGRTGYTDANGTFIYNREDKITFFIQGKIVLGSARAESRITPVDLVDGVQNASDREVTNIARLLQSIDEDQDPENGIVIAQEIRNRAADFSSGINPDFGSNREVRELFDRLTEGCRDLDNQPFQLRNATQARRHLQTSLNGVSIIDQGDYYRVELDYGPGNTRYSATRNYGRELGKMFPDIQKVLDRNLKAAARGSVLTYGMFLLRASSIKQNLPKEYLTEIEGLAAGLANTEYNIMGDGRLSADEILVLNLIADVVRESQCSAISVFEELSPTNNTLVGRNLDWFPGTGGDLERYHAVTKINNSDKSVCLIGYLAQLSIMSGFNNDHVFAALIDASTGEDYPFLAYNMHSYSYDLRYALENRQSMQKVAEYMQQHNYTFNHLVFLADSEKSKVLENNLSGSGPDMKRKLRSSTSDIRSSASWNYEDSVAAVNAFMLPGNHDNFSDVDANKMRWEKINELLSRKSGDGKVTMQDLRSIMTYCGNNRPGAKNSGDLYNYDRNSSLLTEQSMLFEPATYKLRVFFQTGILQNGSPDLDPEFSTVDVDFD